MPDHETEYDFIVTVKTSLPLDDIQAALAKISLPDTEIQSVQWIP